MTQVTLKTCIVIVALSSVGCITNPPYWGGKLWSGDSDRGSIRRAQDNEEMDCKAPEFNGYICMSPEDMQTFYNTYVLGCKQWRSGMPKFSTKEALKMAGEAGIKVW